MEACSSRFVSCDGITRENGSGARILELPLQAHINFPQMSLLNTKTDTFGARSNYITDTILLQKLKISTWLTQGYEKCKVGCVFLRNSDQMTIGTTHSTLPFGYFIYVELLNLESHFIWNLKIGWKLIIPTNGDWRHNFQLIFVISHFELKEFRIFKFFSQDWWPRKWTDHDVTILMMSVRFFDVFQSLELIFNPGSLTWISINGIDFRLINWLQFRKTFYRLVMTILELQRDIFIVQDHLEWLTFIYSSARTVYKTVRTYMISYRE